MLVCGDLFSTILLPNQFTLFPLAFRRRTAGTNPVSWISSCGRVCLAVIVTRSLLVGHSRRLKGSKLDHRDARRECYPQHKWLSAGLIDKLPLHFISRTDRA